MVNALGLTFHLYGLLIGVGIWAAIEVSLWLAKKRSINPRTVNQLIWWTIPAGIIGARLYHVVDFWSSYYSLQPIKVLYVWEGGLGIWGAVIGGVTGLLCYWVVNRKKIPNLFLLLDIIFVGVPLAQAIGRWGNYFNGELIGKNGEPLFLYESWLDLILFAILIKISNNTAGVLSRGGPAQPESVLAGRVAGVYLMGYGVIRFILEFFRPDQVVWKFNGIPMAQIFSVIAIFVGMLIINFPLKARAIKGKQSLKE